MSPTLPLLTADLPAIGGVIKQAPEDFEVEELPAYEPCGEGEHLFLWIEKRNTSAERLVEHVARTLGIARQDVGVAGLKDRHAVTRQYLSVPARAVARPESNDPDAPSVRVAEALSTLNTSDIRVLRSARHRNKLRTGHLRGNRFSIVIRDVVPDAVNRAQAIAARLQSTGFPNYFGEQRFGNDRETLALGLDLLAGRKAARDLPGARRKFLLRLALSAAQSALFNESLAERVTAGRIGVVEYGDVLQVVATGGLFVAEDVAAEQARCEAGETVPTGPMFGPKMKSPAGEPARREQALLDRHGLTPAAFNHYPRLTAGTRRPYVVRVQDLAIRPHPAGLHLEVTLPAGVYATTLLHEFTSDRSQ